MNKQILVSVIVTVVLIGGAFWFVSANPTSTPSVAGENASAVSVVDGKQIIEITAKGGYSPREVTAQAGLPTVLRIRTNGTFDCSSSLVIPKLSYQKFLESTAVEEIEVSSDMARGELQGLCSMGMYNFSVNFI